MVRGGYRQSNYCARLCALRHDRRSTDVPQAGRLQSSGERVDQRAAANLERPAGFACARIDWRGRCGSFQQHMHATPPDRGHSSRGQLRAAGQSRRSSRRRPAREGDDGANGLAFVERHSSHLRRKGAGEAAQREGTPDQRLFEASVAPVRARSGRGVVGLAGARGEVDGRRLSGSTRPNSERSVP